MKWMLTLTLCIWAGSALFADEYGLTSFPVLMMDNYNARAIAMANSTIAIKEDPNAININPAGIASIDRISLSVSRLTWIFDTAFNSFNLVYPIPAENNQYGVLGLTGNLMDSTSWEAFLDGQSLGDQTSGDLYIGIAYALNPLKLFKRELAESIHIDVGLGIRYVQAKLLDYNAGCLSFDLGVSYSLYVPNVVSFLKTTVIEEIAITNLWTNIVTNETTVTKKGKKKGEKEISITMDIFTNISFTNVERSLVDTNRDTLSVGMAFRNLSGVLFSFLPDQTLLAPWVFDFGVYYMIYNDIRHVVGMSLNLNKVSDNHVMLSTGLEYSYKNTIFVRAGYKLLGRTEDGLSFGIGLNFEVFDNLSFRLDYSQNLLSTMGSGNVFTLSVVF